MTGGSQRNDEWNEGLIYTSVPTTATSVDSIIENIHVKKSDCVITKFCTIYLSVNKTNGSMYMYVIWCTPDI